MTAVTAHTGRPGKRARLAPPTQGRGEAWLLLGPAILYLVAFSIYPLITSLVRSFQDYNQIVEQPVSFEDGYAIAPERPGHGLVLSEEARAAFAQPAVE